MEFIELLKGIIQNSETNWWFALILTAIGLFLPFLASFIFPGEPL